MSQSTASTDTQPGQAGDASSARNDAKVLDADSIKTLEKNTLYVVGKTANLFLIAHHDPNNPSADTYAVYNKPDKTPLDSIPADDPAKIAAACNGLKSYKPATAQDIKAFELLLPEKEPVVEKPARAPSEAKLLLAIVPPGRFMTGYEEKGKKTWFQFAHPEGWIPAKKLPPGVKGFSTDDSQKCAEFCTMFVEYVLTDPAQDNQFRDVASWPGVFFHPSFMAKVTDDKFRDNMPSFAEHFDSLVEFKVEQLAGIREAISKAREQEQAQADKEARQDTTRNAKPKPKDTTKPQNAADEEGEEWKKGRESPEPEKPESDKPASAKPEPAGPAPKKPAPSSSSSSSSCYYYGGGGSSSSSDEKLSISNPKVLWGGAAIFTAVSAFFGFSGNDEPQDPNAPKKPWTERISPAVVLSGAAAVALAALAMWKTKQKS